MERIGELLEQQRRSSFVGREAEIELVRSVLEGEDPRLTLLYVHWPSVGATREPGPGSVSTESRRDVWCRLVPTHPLRGGTSRLMPGNPVHLVCTWLLPATGSVGRNGL